jgi:NAD(P)H dehydrogenase (quinone)
MGASISSDPKTIILGANGCVGTATIEAMMLRSEGAANVTAGVRDEKRFAQKLSQVPTVHADLADKTSLKEAMKGFECAFIIVPSTEDRTKFATNALEAAKAAGIKFVLMLSVTLAETKDTTIFGRQFAPIEEKTKSIGIPYTIIRVPLFMENTFQYKETVMKGNRFEDPRDPRIQMATVAVDDVGKCAADILRNPGPHVNKTYNLIGQTYSMIDLTQSMSKVLGRGIKVREIAYRTFKKSQLENNIPEWQIDGLIEWLQHDVDQKVSSEDLQTITKITGDRPTTVDHFVACNAPQFGWRIK